MLRYITLLYNAASGMFMFAAYYYAASGMVLNSLFSDSSTENMLIYFR